MILFSIFRVFVGYFDTEMDLIFWDYLKMFSHLPFGWSLLSFGRRLMSLSTPVMEVANGLRPVYLFHMKLMIPSSRDGFSKNFALTVSYVKGNKLTKIQAACYGVGSCSVSTGLHQSLSGFLLGNSKEMMCLSIKWEVMCTGSGRLILLEDSKVLGYLVKTLQVFVNLFQKGKYMDAYTTIPVWKTSSAGSKFVDGGFGPIYVLQQIVVVNVEAFAMLGNAIPNDGKVFDFYYWSMVDEEVFCVVRAGLFRIRSQVSIDNMEMDLSVQQWVPRAMEGFALGEDNVNDFGFGDEVIVNHGNLLLDNLEHDYNTHDFEWKDNHGFRIVDVYGEFLYNDDVPVEGQFREIENLFLGNPPGSKDVGENLDLVLIVEEDVVKICDVLWRTLLWWHLIRTAWSDFTNDETGIMEGLSEVLLNAKEAHVDDTRWDLNVEHGVECAHIGNAQAICLISFLARS